jgi:aspartyl-tRNA synthetase
MPEEAKIPALDFLGDLERTHNCGELRATQAGQSTVLMGWVNRRRNLGNLIFIDLRDRAGITQVVFDKRADEALHEKAESLRTEYVIAVTGTVRERGVTALNKEMPTGEVEVAAQELLILNVCAQPPFFPSDALLPGEELRLKYRYLDLRRPELQKNIVLRHRVAQAVRQNLTAQGFLEIETPFMTRSTPEGARDYLVPSRVSPGSFYALPQSPQLFKQILMISGLDRYFQIVRCFRDEDLRADRQPEFTQIDLEMSFPQLDEIFTVVESFLGAAFDVAGYQVQTPFPQMSFDQAIELYGTDKPDLRLPPMSNVRAAFSAEDLTKLNVSPELPVILIRTPGVGELSRKERDEIKTLFAIKDAGAKLFEDTKRLEKAFPEAMARARESAGVQAGDLLVLVAGTRSARDVYTGAGALRVLLGQKYANRHNLFKPGEFRFLWVTDFPMFEWDNDRQRWMAAHHPFTSPHERDFDKLESDPAAVRALAYDVVLNGTELGSGSIRIHRQDVQSRIFRALGMSDAEAKERFGFFLEALTYGTPPHGGIALGLDRIVMILAGAESLREVIPFPKTAKAVDLMVDAPTPVDDAQLKELGIKVSASPQAR